MDFDFLNISALDMYQTVISDLMNSVNEPLYPGDERRIYGEALVAIFTNLYTTMNDAAKQRTLQYARGYVLDALGARVGAVRLAPSSASALFRFSLSAVQPQNIIIPAGTRITDGTIYFATDTTAVISPGKLYVDVSATCDISGADYNDIEIGQIKTLVDLIPYIASVSNITTTTGGDNGEPYPWEDDGTGDNRFRERIRLAPASFSVAGPEAAYRYHTLSADPDIIDVFVDSPTPTVVDIYPLMVGGTLPDDDTKSKIQSVFGDDIRPLTDLVNVKSPSQVTYDVELTYYCAKSDEAAAIEAVEGANGAIAQYHTWQTTKLGQSINPDELKKLILNTTSVYRVDIVQPTYTDLEPSQVAQFSGNLTVSHTVKGV